MGRFFSVVILALLLAQQQTPAQLIDQISQLLQQLKQAIAATPPTPTATAVSSSEGLVAALRVGGSITLAAGTYTGNFVIARPSTLTGAGEGSTILVPADLTQPTLTGMANDTTVQDMTVFNGAPDRETVVIGSPSATSIEVQPHRVKLIRLTVTGRSGLGHRGISLHGVDLTIDHCTVTGFAEKGRDSQALWILNGPGPYTVTNSVFEASGENILVGGSDPGIPGVLPADIIIRGNTLRKPAIYHTSGTVKNLLELKTGVRVLIEGNTFDGNWRDGQSGNAIVFTVRNQDGKCTWCRVDEVTFRNNLILNGLDGFGVNILGMDDAGPSGRTARMVIDHNLFRDSPLGIQVINGPTDSLVITNNTFPKITSKFLSFTTTSGIAKVLTPFTFSRNVTRMGSYGVTGDGSTGPGLSSLTANVQLVEWNGNIIETTPERTISLPSGIGNVFVSPGGLAALLDAASFKLLNGAAGY